MPLSLPFRAQGAARLRLEDPSGFSLTELLVVIAATATLAILAVPNLASLQISGSTNLAADEITQAMQVARAYAISHDTYTWLGFYEEDATMPSANPAQQGVGRVILSIVASNDGTALYSASSTPPISIPPTSLVQVSPLIRVQNIHLESFSNGTGTGITFDTRPALSSPNAQIGGSAVPNNAYPSFQYPVGQASSAQYVFNQVLQFSPRGETLASGMAGAMTPLIEVGLQPTHGNVLYATSPNLVALQISGISGSIISYRR
ncbi:MAG TPA: prepilin-type N-terminal cleavage/methylation domain-containing protein [Candidatus Methylacidiphilales bacterium]|jgi:prepilin-type N-terminal cleavage/methylation domain-containing protein|nr:prepilin-type N-terminal cleavage/methylation domain-containing protein [Candidatus Methylacidiphilales bacterium]